MNYINVCYCADKVYAQQLPETISYLKKFYRDERELRVSLITNQDISIPGVETVRIPWKRSIAQLRVMIPSIMDNRCIYLDSDTVVSTCISRLWDTEISGSVGMVQSKTIPTCEVASQKYDIPELASIKRTYYNSGVMLFDCEVWKSKDMSARCIQMFDKYSDTNSRYNDEPGINMAVDDCHTLDTTWNYYPESSTPYKKANIVHDYGRYMNGKPRHSLFNQ